jgi:hypothetical protein
MTELLKNILMNIKILDTNCQNLDVAQKNMAAQVASDNANIAVMSRMFMRYMNRVIEEINNLGAEKLKPLTTDELEAEFKEYAKFSSRPDANKLWLEWTSGVRYEDLPEPPAIEMKEGIVAPSSQDEGYAEATVFGGDYGEKGNAVQERTTSESETRDEVPSVQSSAGEEDQPSDG